MRVISQCRVPVQFSDCNSDYTVVALVLIAICPYKFPVQIYASHTMIFE